MRSLILILMLCLITTFAFAEVTAEIIAQDLDDNGNIRVWAQYKVDGVEVESRYPKIDGHSVYCTRYNKKHFLGMSKAEIADQIEWDLSNHCQTLVGQEFDKNAPKAQKEILIDYNRRANEDFVATSFPTLVGRKVIEEEKTIFLDTDNDGQNDKEIKVRTDGTKTEKDIIGP